MAKPSSSFDAQRKFHIRFAPCGGQRRAGHQRKLHVVATDRTSILRLPRQSPRCLSLKIGAVNPVFEHLDGLFKEPPTRIHVLSLVVVRVIPVFTNDQDAVDRQFVRIERQRLLGSRAESATRTGLPCRGSDRQRETGRRTSKRPEFAANRFPQY